MKKSTRLSVTEKHDPNNYCVECLKKEGRIEALKTLLKFQEELNVKIAKELGRYDRMFGITNTADRLFEKAESSIRVLHVVKQ